jgi:hypothetical protein
VNQAVKTLRTVMMTVTGERTSNNSGRSVARMQLCSWAAEKSCMFAASLVAAGARELCSLLVTGFVVSMYQACCRQSSRCELAFAIVLE